MSKYIFKPYNPIFPELFEKEKQRLSLFLTGNYQIEHIGSTAVPGLGGKGIIDIYIVAPKNDLDRISDEVLKSGYEYRPRVSPDQHLFHRIDLPDPIEEIRRYHVHINFPDAEAKRKAAEDANQNKDKYMAIKTPVIQEVLKKALL